MVMSALNKILQLWRDELGEISGCSTAEHAVYSLWGHQAISRSSHCSTTGVITASEYILLSVG